MLVLTFHSIAAGSGPTSIPPDTFAMQMDVLAENGFQSATCAEFLDWHTGHLALAGRRVLLTFDDGYADFAATALPILRDRGFSPIVFVPTGRLGGCEDWRGANTPARPLMSWTTVEELARAGVEFGGHGVLHADLTKLSPEERREEIDRGAQMLSEKTGQSIRAFAAPYGNVNRAVLADIARSYDVAFGTQLARARQTSDRFDIPRVEMHYFRRRRHWEAFVHGDDAYFLARRILRAGKRLLASVGTAE